MKTCETCKHAIFDETWGEYKCKIKGHRIYDSSDNVYCSSYEKKKVKDKK